MCLDGNGRRRCFNEQIGTTEKARWIVGSKIGDRSTGSDDRPLHARRRPSPRARRAISRSPRRARTARRYQRLEGTKAVEPPSRLHVVPSGDRPGAREGSLGSSLFSVLSGAMYWGDCGGDEVTKQKILPAIGRSKPVEGIGSKRPYEAGTRRETMGDGVKKSKSVLVLLTRAQCSAISDAVADCAMEGFSDDVLAPNAEETWGENWKERRRIAVTAANKLARIGSRSRLPKRKLGRCKERMRG